MRLSVLDNGHRRRARLFMAVTGKLSGVTSPDIVKLLLYRPGFLTRPLLELTAPAMRGESYWTAGEREYLAMSTARVHECPFCVVTHAELTRIAGHGEIDPDRPLDARPELRAVQRFLEDVSRDLEPVPPSDLPAQAVLEALNVNLVWNIVNRLANAFGFELRPPRERLRAAGADEPGAAAGGRDGRGAAGAVAGLRDVGPRRVPPHHRRRRPAAARGGVYRGRDLRGHGGRGGRCRAAQLRRRPRRAEGARRLGRTGQCGSRKARPRIHPDARGE
jgi:AhpD family alkylhydroperoxidase